MTTSTIKKTFAAVALGLTMSLQLISPAFAATNSQVLTAAQAGVNYLSVNQGVDGSVAGFGGVTDWAAIAIAANGQEVAAFKNGGASITDSLMANPLTSTALATDVEKRLLAIFAAGEDTADFGGVDYNALLATYHNTQQIGDPMLLNDDIFGVIAAAAADDPDLEAMAQDGLDYFIAHQAIDGGFSYTTDTCAYCGSDSNDTAAAIIALEAAKSMGLTNAGLDDAKDKAVAYLLSTAQTDGGFGYDIFSPSDGSSTAWSLMALNALGEDVETQALAARDWLLANQNTDGGFRFAAYGTLDSDTYTTSHAVTALLGTTWLLQPEPLEQPAPQPTPATPAPTPIPQAAQPIKLKTVTTSQPIVHDAEVLSQETTTADTAQDDAAKADPTKKDIATKVDKKDGKINYLVFVIIGLSVVAIVWYVLRPKSK